MESMLSIDDGSFCMKELHIARYLVDPTQPNSLHPLSLQGLELAHHGSVNDALFSPSEGRIATAGGDGLVKVCSHPNYHSID
jgi:WD40 repeat protein